MFETIAGVGSQIPPYRQVRSVLVSVAGHSLLVFAFLAIPFLTPSDQLPKVPTMMAFVAAAPPPPPPPPPPAPAAKSEAATKRLEDLSANAFAAPIEVPDEIVPESGLASGFAGGGEVGGVEGGVPGGILGGVLGGLPTEVPPPPVVARAEPVRVGGAITPPAVVARVAPTYPELALVAQIEGLVILEATVDTDGRVESVRVLRSAGLLDDAAMAAVRQWRYSPLSLNGVPTPFILTVTVAFQLDG
jgi:protein TonB